jgi:hypothetical protein
MSDTIENENGKKGKLEQLSEKPFFAFSKPYLDFIGKGKIYGLVYFLMAAVSVLLPFVIFYAVIDSGLFRYGAKFVFAFIFSWLVILFACWIGFQLWWDRRKKIMEIGASEFSATLIFSQILQTLGEWLGTLIGIIGAGAGLIATIFLGSEINYFFYALNLDFMALGPSVIVAGPILGFFIIIFTRFLAEQLRIWASIANSTKEIADVSKNRQ